MKITIKIIMCLMFVAAAGAESISAASLNAVIYEKPQTGDKSPLKVFRAESNANQKQNLLEDATVRTPATIFLRSLAQDKSVQIADRFAINFMSDESFAMDRQQIFPFVNAEGVLDESIWIGTKFTGKIVSDDSDSFFLSYEYAYHSPSKPIKPKTDIAAERVEIKSNGSNGQIKLDKNIVQIVNGFDQPNGKVRYLAVYVTSDK